MRRRPRFSGLEKASLKAGRVESQRISPRSRAKQHLAISSRGRMKKLSAVLLVTLTSLVLAQPPSPLLPAEQKAVNAVDAEKIRATVKYLSDDALQGRGTGQKGGDMAADWIALQFKSYGLIPAGDAGTYFQEVRFLGVTTDPRQTQFIFVPKSGAEINLKFADDYVATDQTHA